MRKKDKKTEKRIVCFIERDERKIIVRGQDTKGLLSHIVGFISLQGISIERAESTSTKIEGKRYFEDVFFVKYKEEMKESWSEDISHLIETQLQLIYDGKHSSSQRSIIENYVDFISLHHKKYSNPPVVDIDIEHGEFLTILVKGEEAPFLLYMISTALEYQRLSVLEFSIKTHQNYIEDKFVVEGNNSWGEEEIKKLRLSLLLSIQFIYFLRKSPDPYKGFLYLLEIIENIGYEDRMIEDFLFSDSKHKENLLMLLGSGDYLWEDFIRSQSSEIINII